ncbi:uncharacterized protein LOC115023417 [Scomber scombrus]|uniref:Ubiquitin carboxyl-terminal hydrolase n=1 Tax=Scomber scombrus TaxID=13677 RepID=A0AAV1N131_SCOSC
MGKIYQVVVHGLKDEKMVIDLSNTEEQMQSMTVKQLKEKIAERLPGNAVNRSRRSLSERKIKAIKMDRMGSRQLSSGIVNNLVPAANKYGLMNQGATCYLNSVLQVLFRTKKFRQTVKRHTCKNPHCMDCHLKSLFDDLEKRTARTNKITRTLGIDRVSEQRDAAEYLQKILSLTSDGASQLFHGELTHTKKCACGTQTNTGGQYWHLPLALVDSCSEVYSVVDGIENFFSTSNVDGENKMYCDDCDDKADATLRSVMTHHPDVLTLLLKRFEFDYRYMAYVKIKCTVDVPFTLQIPENQTYELYAVVDHFGDLRSGHYTATIKSDDDDDDRWYNFDDTNVSVNDHQPFIKKSQSAYLLLYKKKTMNAADCTQDTREMSSPEGLQLYISDNYEQHQDVVMIREEHEGKGEEKVGNDSAEDVYIDGYEEKESGDKDMTGVIEMTSGYVTDIGREIGADDQAEKTEVLSVGTQLDKIVEVQSNDSGGIDDTTLRGLQEHLVGDVRQNTPQMNYVKQDVSDGHEQHSYFNKQDNMSNTQMTDEDGKTRSEQLEKNRISSTEYLTKNDKDYEDNVQICQNISEHQEKQYCNLNPFSMDKMGEEERKEMNVKGNEERKIGDDELASWSGKSFFVMQSEVQNKSRVSDSKQIIPKDIHERPQQPSEEEKGVTGENERKRGDDEQVERVGASHKQQHFSQSEKDQNNVGFDNGQDTPEKKISITTHEDVDVEKQAKEQGQKGENEHTQNGEDSSLPQTGLEGRGRLTQNQRFDSDEKMRHVKSQAKAKSAFKEGTMEVRDGTEQGKIIYGKIIEEEYKHHDDGVTKSSTTKNIRITVRTTPKGTRKSCVRFIEINAKSGHKTEQQDILSMGVCNLNLNESNKHSTKRCIGSVEQGNEAIFATDSNAKKSRVVTDAEAAGI